MVGEAGLLCATEDGGATWRRVETGVQAWLRALDFPDPQHGFIGGSGVLLASNDGGATWRAVAYPGGKINAVYFEDARRGVLATMQGQLLATRNGGETWSVALEHGGELAGIAPGPGGRMLVVGGAGAIFARQQ